MSEDEKLYVATAIVLVKATNSKEAKEKIRSRKLIVDDIIEIKEDKLNHIKEETQRKKLREQILRDLRFIERRV